MNIETIQQQRADLIRRRALGQPIDPEEFAKVDAALAEHQRQQQLEREVTQVRDQIDAERRNANAKAELERLESVTGNALNAVQEAAKSVEQALEVAKQKLQEWREAEDALVAAMDEARSVAMPLTRKATAYTTSQGHRIDILLVRHPNTETQQLLAQVPRPMKL